MVMHQTDSHLITQLFERQRSKKTINANEKWRWSGNKNLTVFIIKIDWEIKKQGQNLGMKININKKNRSMIFISWTGWKIEKIKLN